MTTTSTTCDITNGDGKNITILTENRGERKCEHCDLIGYYDKENDMGDYMPYRWGYDEYSELYYCEQTCDAGEFGPVVCEICDQESDARCYLDDYDSKENVMNDEGWDYGTEDKEDPNYSRDAEGGPICYDCQENFPSNYTISSINALHQRIAKLEREAAEHHRAMRQGVADMGHNIAVAKALEEKVAEQKATITASENLVKWWRDTAVEQRKLTDAAESSSEEEDETRDERCAVCKREATIVYDDLDGWHDAEGETWTQQDGDRSGDFYTCNQCCE